MANPNSAPFMPSDNTTGNKFGTGAGKKSQFTEAHDHKADKAAGIKEGSKRDVKLDSSKPTIDSHNVTGSRGKVQLGHTKHGVGQVPGYLKGK